MQVKYLIVEFANRSTCYNFMFLFHLAEKCFLLHLKCRTFQSGKWFGGDLLLVRNELTMFRLSIG